MKRTRTLEGHPRTDVQPSGSGARLLATLGKAHSPL